MGTMSMMETNELMKLIYSVRTMKIGRGLNWR
jgi:hypothetical protein